MINGLLGQVGGYQVYINKMLNYKVVKRTWKERLFTRPWKPFLKAKSIPDGYFIKDGQFYKMEGKLMCNPITANALKNEIDNKAF